MRITIWTAIICSFVGGGALVTVKRFYPNKVFETHIDLGELNQAFPLKHFVAPVLIRIMIKEFSQPATWTRSPPVHTHNHQLHLSCFLSEYFLEDCIQMTHFVPPPVDRKKKDKDDEGGEDDVRTLFTWCFTSTGKNSVLQLIRYVGIRCTVTSPADQREWPHIAPTTCWCCTKSNTNNFISICLTAVDMPVTLSVPDERTRLQQ